MSSPGKLLICPTPLGNLGDITQRTIDALQQCDIVYCEDTRVTGKLLSWLTIEKRLERLDEASLSKKAPQVIAKIQSGETVAYATDAGMPGVSDPGQRLIHYAYEHDVSVEVLPGPTAVTTAYVASGFVSQSFYFGAFFPRKEGERQRLLEALKPLQAVLIFYESPVRLTSALAAIQQVLPYRSVAVCRELTKLHQEVVRGGIDEVYQVFTERERQHPIKGEIVVVIDAPGEEELIQDNESVKERATQKAQELLRDPHYTKKDIVAILKKDYHLSRNEAYALIHD